MAEAISKISLNSALKNRCMTMTVVGEQQITDTTVVGAT